MPTGRNEPSNRTVRRQRIRFALAASVAIAGTLALAQRPLTAPLPAEVEIAELTWVEVRSLLQHGYTTAIVPSGGLEQNGPHLAIGKHDRIVALTAKRIAAALGRTLVTPVISFVPQGATRRRPATCAFRARSGCRRRSLPERSTASRGRSRQRASGRSASSPIMAAACRPRTASRSA
jgi:hypothetical protein